jgi:hypothetical protein
MILQQNNILTPTRLITTIISEEQPQNIVRMDNTADL